VPSGEPPAPIVRGPVTVRGFPSDHAPHIFGLLFMHVDGDLTEQTSLPTRAGEYVDGITQVHLVDFHDSTGKVAFRVFANGAASSKRGAEALARAKTLVRQHPTDVAILCVPGWDQVEEYPESVLGLLQHIGPDGRPRKGPRHVVLSHYDDFWAPYRNGEDPKVDGGMDFVIRANYAGFLDKLRKLKAEQGYTFEVHEPKTGQCLGFAGGGAPRPDQRRPLPCER
jgi:hypothetical protein